LRLEAILTASVAAMVLSGCATTYPVKDAKAAIAVAKDICHEKPSQAGDWRAFERIDGGAWGGNRTAPRRHEPLRYSSEKWAIPLGDFDVPPFARPEASDLGLRISRIVGADFA
jgi:hypothetical protein